MEVGGLSMGYKQEEFNIEVGTSIISAFQRIDIENFRIFSEFIDNSFQSYLDHKDVLINELHVKPCTVEITWTEDEVVVKDNAFGMDKEGFSRALRLNAPASHYSEGSLSKYGMGLKYAASNMGSLYIIETSAYGSKNRYKGTIDVEEWKRNNPKKMLAEVYDDFDENKHFTSITIKRLYHKFDLNQMKKAITKLASMYARFIEKKMLSISINGVNVKYDDPELDKDENGSTVEETFESSFIHENKVYKYWGWAGVLKTGRTSDAGFTIIQNGRGIMFNFRPEEVFGKPNDFKYQRIVGEIELDKDNWDVRVNKDGVAWNANGLLEVFSDNLSKLAKIKKIAKYAKEKRKDDKRKVSVDAKNCFVSGTKTSYKTGERIVFSVNPYENFKLEEVRVNSVTLPAQNAEKTQYAYDVTSDTPSKINIKVICKEIKTITTVPDTDNGGTVVVNPPSNDSDAKRPEVLTRDQIISKMFESLKNTSVPGESIVRNPNHKPGGIVIEYANTSYSFELIENYDVHEDSFIELKTAVVPYENSYSLSINFKCGIFDSLYLNADSKDSIAVLAISMALARITGEANGLKLEDSRIFMDKFNDIIAKTKK
jgi:hypothetical protein